jgi:hypothetical protein
MNELLWRTVRYSNYSDNFWTKWADEMIITFVSFAHNIGIRRTLIESRSEDRLSWSFSWKFLLCPGSTRSIPFHFKLVQFIIQKLVSFMPYSPRYWWRREVNINIEWLPVLTLLHFFHWLYSPLGPWPLIFSFMIILQTVGLLGRVISSSQGLYHGYVDSCEESASEIQCLKIIDQRFAVMYGYCIQSWIPTNSVLIPWKQLKPAREYFVRCFVNIFLFDKIYRLV